MQCLQRSLAARLLNDYQSNRNNGRAEEKQSFSLASDDEIETGCNQQEQKHRLTKCAADNMQQPSRNRLVQDVGPHLRQTSLSFRLVQSFEPERAFARFVVQHDQHWWWVLFLTWTFILSHSLIYESLAWAAAMVFGGPLGTAYLGTQWDEWDSQKDMALASFGAAIALATLMLRGTRTSRTSA